MGYLPIDKVAGAKRARLNLEPVPLRRNGALGEEGFRGLYPENIKLPDPNPTAPLKKNKKKKSSLKPAPGKTVGKKRPADAGVFVFPENGQLPDRVRIPFPPMQAPFGGPKKFENSKNTATFTLSFKGEATSPELQQLRQLLTKVEEVMGEFIKLIRPKGVVTAPISADQKNTFIREGARVAVGSAERWPDLVYLKAYPEMRFKTTYGQVMKMADVLLELYHIQPVVELRDIVTVGGIYYPRLVVTECVLHPRESPVLMMGAPEDTDDLEEGEDPNIMLPGV